LQHKVLFIVKTRNNNSFFFTQIIHLPNKLYAMKRLIFLCCLALLASCKVFNPSQMLRTKAGYEFSHLQDSVAGEYRIATNDVISFVILPNKGERLVTGTNDQSGSSNLMTNMQTYIIGFDGTAKLPLLGSTKFIGLTKCEAEKMLEEKYSSFINNPFVKLDIDNRRVFIFRGGNNSSVVKLENENTSLFEVLAKSGGTDDSKAHRIKLIRKVNNVPQVYLIDLSKVENINQGNIVLQSNDIIYITPRDRIPEKILATIAPYLSLVATAIAVIAIFKK
jgi:polysaccharide biosynthesis/export protein